jgi:hypothetical protein
MSFQKPFALQYFAVLVDANIVYLILLGPTDSDVFAITAPLRPLDSTGREVGWHATAWKKKET